MKYQSYLLSILIVLTLTMCSKHQSQETKNSTPGWRVIGPGGGGGVSKPTVSPFDEKLVLTHCDMTGAYITHDGGESWRMFNLWTVPTDFEFDPLDPNTIYVATRGYRHSEDRGSGLSMLFRSRDRGQRWMIIYPDIEKAVKVKNLQSKDLLPSEIIPGAFDGSIDVVQVDPMENDHIFMGLSPLRAYIGTADQGVDSVMIVHSTDAGDSWQRITGLPGKQVLNIFPGYSGTSAGNLLVFTGSACFDIDISTGKYESWPLPVPKIKSAQGGANHEKKAIYIMAEGSRLPDGRLRGGLYVSHDGGKSWKQINNGLLTGIPSDRVPRFRGGPGVCETAPDVAYVSMINPVKLDDGTVEQQYAIFKTTDGGSHWEHVFLSSSRRGYIIDNYTGGWLDRSYDPGWGGSPYNLGVAPGNPDICFGGDNGRGYKTEDGGQTWQQVYSTDLPDGSFTTNGLNVTTCYGVHFDPFDKEHFFISYTDVSLFHTYNGGKSWYHSINGIPRPWRNTCYWVVFDPAVRGRVWSAWARAHDLPRDKMFGPGGFDHFPGGVAYSEDGGKSWEKSNNGMPENAIITHILLDPESHAGSRTLYATVFDKGIYKTTDGGKHWQPANNGLGDNLFAWQMRLSPSGRLFALFARGRRNGDTVPGALYFSDDQGGNWRPLSLPRGVNAPHDLLIDPNDEKRMYLSCWVRTIDGQDRYGGVYRTDDGGQSWHQVFDESIRVNSAAVMPGKSNVIFINTFHNAAYRSDDFGETWSRLEGYRFKWGQRVIPDIHDPDMIFLTTFGGSVFYGPATGVKGAFEDIENMPEGWW